VTVTDIEWEWESFNWIIVARARYNWQAVVNTVMSIRVASNTRGFVLDVDLLASEEGLFST
jgi:hypothetical protein